MVDIRKFKEKSVDLKMFFTIDEALGKLTFKVANQYKFDFNSKIKNWNTIHLDCVIGKGGMESTKIGESNYL